MVTYFDVQAEKFPSGMERDVSRSKKRDAEQCDVAMVEEEVERDVLVTWALLRNSKDRACDVCIGTTRKGSPCDV